MIFFLKNSLLSRTTCFFFIFGMMFTFTAGIINASNSDLDMAARKNKILLLGASISKAWNVETLPDRVDDHSFQIELQTKYEPDKSDILDQALDRDHEKPDIIIIKQCASYFKADTATYHPEYVAHYEQLAKDWVNKIREHEITPILATVVPITEKMPLKIKLKRFIKKYILGRKISPYYRPVRLEGIIDYNNWVRSYSKKNDLVILDLETGVRLSEENRYLDPKLSTDGLHLNKKGYERLDPILVDAIKNAAH